MYITPEELMAGGSITHDVEIPPQILSPRPDGGDIPDDASKDTSNKERGKTVKIRPLTVKDVQLIAKAAKDDDVLTSVLMIRKAVVEPPLEQAMVAKMHSGLVRFLVDRINQISGLTTSEDDIREITQSPIVRAFYVLAKEFNWTPQQVKEMTLGQILGYLELLNQSKKGNA